LKVTTEPLESHQLAVTIEVDQGRTEQAMRRAARQIAREVRIPGFRPGKAPFDAIVQRFGESTVRREAADLIGEEVVREALEQENIDAYGPGQITNLTLDPLVYELAVPLNPTVDLGDYRAIRLDPEPVEVRDDQLQQALDKIREDNTIFETIERPSIWRDGLELDLVAHTDSGEEVLKGEGLHMLLEPETTDPVPGFPEAVLGMEAGEERTFRLPLPPDFPEERFRGTEAEFTVTINTVYNQIIPDLDDDLARAVGNFETLDELRDHLRGQIQQAAQAERDRAYAAQVVEAAVKQAKVDFPPPMVDRELDEMVKEVERSVRSQRRLSMEDFLRIERKSIDELREELRPSAEARLTKALILGDVVRLEELAVEDDEVGERIEQVSSSWGSRAEQVRTSLSTDAGRRAMQNRLLADKAVQRLVAIAKGELKQEETTAGRQQDAGGQPVEGEPEAPASEAPDGVEPAATSIDQPEDAKPADEPVASDVEDSQPTSDPAAEQRAAMDAPGTEEALAPENAEPGDSE
jgi:trigger factor